MPCSPRAARRFLLLAFTLFAAAAPSAAAAPLPGSSYDTGDGDQVATGAPDWQTATSVESPDANDDCFVGGVKELAPKDWAFDRSAGGCTPGKSNLRVAYANPESALATTFGHFAFFRNDTTGNSFLTFELNQRSTSWTNPTGTTIPCRSTGDLLLSFEVGGSSLTTSLYRWLGDGSGPAACPDGAAGTFTGSGTIPAGRFQGAMNGAAPITNFVSPLRYGATFPANSFGEAAIDIPAVLKGMGASPCFGFLQMQVHSRSSSSISSAMIDYTTPVPVHIQSCAVTGTQFQDSDGDGARDAGEPGLAGFRMYADLDDDGTRDAGEPSGVSDAAGFYRILDVPAGTTRIRQEPRAGWRCSAPSPCAYSRTLTTSGNSTGNDFGALGPSTASGTVFDDLDADGVRDAGEPGLPGVTHYADLDGDGALDAGEPAAASADDGTFLVADVPAGTYAIRQAARAGWTCSAGCASTQTFSSGSAATGLLSGAYAPAALAGHVTESGAAIAGAQVYLDANGNDLFDVGERQTTTGATGAYAFAGLVPATYAVRVTRDASWFCATACELTATLVSAQSLGGQDLGFLRAATVSGTVFDDANNSGVRDSGEGALAGFTQWVDYDGDAALDAGEPSAVSDAAGAYAIGGVRPGSYTLRQAPNGAYACTKPAPCTYALTLGSGAVAGAREFGAYVSRSVSGTVFNDADRSGTLGAGESGLAGWTVYSDQDSNGVPSAGDPQATTNSLGQYNLTGLANGNYRIKIVVQATWTCSAPAGCTNTGSIGSGQSDAGMNFGVWGPATIRGTLFEDLDGDGAAREAGEPGLSARTVFADKDGDAVLDADERSATSDANGEYAITGVDPGTYTVRQQLPGGWTCTRPSPCSYGVVTSAGGLTARDFGSRTTASVSGTLFEDADADGAARAGGEAGLAGRTVFLDADDDGAHDGGEASVVSGAGGAYSFTGLAPGTYRVRQVLPGGWTASGAGHDVTVASGSAPTARDLASFTTGSIAGSAFEDADFDNSPRETGDAPLAGRTVFLDADDDGTLDAGESTATTDAAGDYAFTGLRPGAYRVRAVMPATWACAYPAACAQTVAVASRVAATGPAFGAYVGASVSGVVFDDLDADGAARETGEPGLAQRRVYLDADGDAVRDEGEPSTTTDTTGAYAFSGITARTWQARLELPAGAACDRPSPCRHDLALTSGADRAGADFGVHAAGTIAGHLFTDRDADREPQAFGENDQPERTVFLDADGDGALGAGERTATTDDRGDYVFAGVAPGEHRVRQVLPAGWTCSTPDPCAHVVTVRSGEAVGGRDFSSWTTASLTGTYYEDADADGDFVEPGESGAAARDVYLDLDLDGARDRDEPAETTDAGGRFRFAGLAPDTYVVRSAAQPAGWTCSYPSPCAAELTLEANERAQDVNFGAWTTGTVTGVVTRDGDDAPLAGRTVFADLDDDGRADAGEPSAVTVGNGAYALTLRPGAYAIRQAVPAGWTCASPDPCAHAVTVTSGDTVTSRDFAAAQGAFLSGVVFEDRGADGTRDEGTGSGGDPGLAGVDVFVDADGDATRDAGEPATTTDADGAYSIPAQAGEHTVRVVPPAGFECSACSHARTLAVGESASDLDFALFRRASVTGVVRDDTDGDGSGEPGEPGAEGLVVYADLDGDETFDDGEEPSDAADATGAYALDGLRPGTYAIRLALPAGRHCTVACAATVTLASGDDATRDFAAWRESTIAGTAFEDADADGAARESGEGPLAGRTVFLDADRDGQRDDDEPSATTDETGAYRFAALRPGTYPVRLDVPAGWRCTRPDPCTTDVAVDSGTAPAGPDFGALAVAADLGVEVTRAAGPLVAGRATSWTVTARNAGPVTADGATLTLTLPEGLSDVAWTAERCSGTGDARACAPLDASACARSGQTITCALGDLAVGDTVALTLSARVGPGRGGADLELRAAVASDQPDPRPADDAAATDDPVGAIADLQATAQLPAKADVGAVVDLVLALTNDGPSDAAGVTLTATLPEGLDAVADRLPAGCALSGRIVTCVVGDLALDATANRTIPVRVGPAAGGRQLAVPVAATGTTPDPTPADALAEADLVAAPSADVRVEVTDQPKPTDGGLRYGLTVRNAGPSTATEVTLSDGPFPGARIVSATSDRGTCAVEDGRLRCTLGTLADGEEIHITVVLEVDDAVDPTTIALTPTARAAESDPAPADNSRPVALPPRVQTTALTPARDEPAVDAAPIVVTAPPTTAPCASLRAFDVKVRRRHGQRLRGVTMTLAGQPLKVVRRDGRFVARVDLRGRSQGASVLRIRAVTATGRVLRGTRTYHPCVEQRRDSVPVL